MHRDAGRDWEHQPRCGWDDFQAARRRHLMRLAAQSERFNRRGASPPDERLPSTPRRGALTLADRLCEGTPTCLLHQHCGVLVDRRSRRLRPLDHHGGYGAGLTRGQDHSPLDAA